MQANNAGDIILKVCSSLPVLSRYYARYEDSAIHGKSLHLPVTYTDAMTIKSALPQISSGIYYYYYYTYYHLLYIYIILLCHLFLYLFRYFTTIIWNIITYTGTLDTKQNKTVVKMCYGRSLLCGSDINFKQCINDDCDRFAKNATASDH